MATNVVKANQKKHSNKMKDLIKAQQKKLDRLTAQRQRLLNQEERQIYAMKDKVSKLQEKLNTGIAHVAKIMNVQIPEERVKDSIDPYAHLTALVNERKR